MHESTPPLPGDDASRPEPAPGSRAFAALYKEAAPSLVAWATLRIPSTVRRHVDPEDIVQEVCVRAFDRYAAFDPQRGPFRAWLFGIATNVLREAMVDAGKRRIEDRGLSPSSRSSGRDLPDDITSVSRRACRDEALAAFVAHLATLPEEDRRLVVYRGLERHPHARIAELFGKSVAAVEKRWQRLLSDLEPHRPPADLLGP